MIRNDNLEIDQAYQMKDDIKINI